MITLGLVILEICSNSFVKFVNIEDCETDVVYFYGTAHAAPISHGIEEFI